MRVRLRFIASRATVRRRWGGGGNANTVNFDAGNFGQITTQAGTPRIFQFGIKYVF